MPCAKLMSCYYLSLSWAHVTYTQRWAQLILRFNLDNLLNDSVLFIHRVFIHFCTCFFSILFVNIVTIAFNVTIFC